MQNYSYNCKDKSIILPYFKMYYVFLYFKIVPKWLTANFITIFSTGFLFFLFFISIKIPDLPTEFFAALFAFCVHAYVVGDHLDGMQAKETKTGSALGEFFDHYLDVFNGAIVFFVLTIFLKPVPAELFYLFMLLNCIAFAATAMEELETKELIFGYIGTLEGLILLILFLISWLIPDIRGWWQYEIILGYPNYYLMILGMGFGYIGTILDIFWRLKYSPVQFNVFVICSTVLAYVLLTTRIDYLLGWLVLLFYCSEYIAKVMRSYLLSQKHQYPDRIITILICMIGINHFVQMFPELNIQWVLMSVIAYLFIKVCWLFGLTLYNLRTHWYWINP